MRSRTAVVACLTLVAACGGNGQQPQAATTATTQATTTTSAVPTTSAAGAVTAADTSIGTVLVDPEGMTLYGFTVDDPGSSNCEGDCAGTWPPVPGDTAVGSDVDRALVSTTTRSDGSTQLVVGDRPVYRFAGDTRPGDTNGQGINDVWFAITPDGSLVDGPQTSTTDAGSAGGTDAGVAVTTTELGPTLVDADGMTLYGFTKDTPGTSACTDACAGTWPPVPGDMLLGAGVDASIFSTITRPDGTTQLTAGGWPLYRYAPDSAPGDITGQGVGGVWFVVATDGTLYD